MVLRVFKCLYCANLGFAASKITACVLSRTSVVLLSLVLPECCGLYNQLPMCASHSGGRKRSKTEEAVFPYKTALDIWIHSTLC